MSINVAMQFGRNGRAVQNRPGLKFVRGGEIPDDTTVVLDFVAGGLYVLAVKVWTASTGAYRGHSLYYITAPEDSVFGTVAIARTTFATGGTMSVTMTNNADSTLSIVQSSAKYNWRYALYRVDGNGNPPIESSIETYTGTYSVTPSVAAQSLGTANKLMTADLEVQEIPTDYGQVTQTGTDLSIS